MIESHDLIKRYGGRAVVDDVSFTSGLETVTRILGSDDAADTTTLPMLAGLSTPDGRHAHVLRVDRLLDGSDGE